jgi:nicotinamide mononucleotide (NMN) deamidase PncC
MLGIAPELTATVGLAGAEVARATAVACRQRFASDYGLAVGGFPAVAREDPQPVVFALASAAGVQVKQVPFAGHPDWLRVYCAKHALNVVRLALSD